MTEKNLFEYLEFLKIECLRHSKDKFISNDEINQLKIEITFFLDRVKEAYFSKEIKKELFKIDFNIAEENYERSKFKWLNFVGNFIGKETKEQINRKNRFEKLYNDLDSSLFKIKSII